MTTDTIENEHPIWTKFWEADQAVDSRVMDIEMYTLFSGEAPHRLAFYMEI
jgi:hypothetical protein